MVLLSASRCLNWDRKARNGPIYVVCSNELLACKIVIVLAVKFICHYKKSDYNVIPLHSLCSTWIVELETSWMCDMCNKLNKGLRLKT